LSDSAPYTDQRTGVHSHRGVAGLAHRKGAQKAVCVLGVPENRGIH
jgi:hypothetical protein